MFVGDIWNFYPSSREKLFEYVATSDGIVKWFMGSAFIKVRSVYHEPKMILPGVVTSITGNGSIKTWNLKEILHNQNLQICYKLS